MKSKTHKIAKKRVVIKIGTRVLTGDHGSLNEDRIVEFLQVISEAEGMEFVLVSSGAVGLGRQVLSLQGKIDLSEKQACAAVGQVRLMDAYRRIGERFQLGVAQLLVTHSDFSSRNKYLNLRNTLEKLLELGVLPILNENDPLSVEELQEFSRDLSFGDNDRLSAIIAAKLDADLLVLLTDVRGVYTDNPKLNKNAEIIPIIEDVSSLSVRIVGTSDLGRGGMNSKLEACRLASLAGIESVIASGSARGTLGKLLLEGGAVGTKIRAQHETSSRKRWLGLASGFSGILVVNVGAQKAIEENGASLLAAGVVGVQGKFKADDVVKIISEEGIEVGRGMVELDSSTCREMIGLKSKEIKEKLGDKAKKFLVHRNNLLVFRLVDNDTEK